MAPLPGPRRTVRLRRWQREPGIGEVLMGLGLPVAGRLDQQRSHGGATQLAWLEA